VKPAAPLLPVSSFTQIASTSSIAESPYIDSAWPTKSNRKSGWRNKAVKPIVTPGRGGEPVSHDRPQLGT
jgi:hypothetical protein